MSAWPGKYVIGLTGNIATGKSVVRKMLEHLGAYGIDADALGHRAIAHGAPGYAAVVETFGTWILGEDKQIDRSKLARTVFSDEEALKRLEAIVHPLVRQAVDLLIKRAKQSVIVLEAIKLLESPLRQSCDSIWVATAPPEVQMQRLVEKRGMSRSVAHQRITVQSSQQEKISAASVIIQNGGVFDETWRQVVAAWQNYVPFREAPQPVSMQARPEVPGEPVIEKARPGQAAEIASFITQSSRGLKQIGPEDIMAAFGEKAFVLVRSSNRLVGLVGWQVENLVARIDDIYLEESLPLETIMQPLLEEVERASRDLQCEASLLFLPGKLVQHREVWHNLGYEPRSIRNLGVRAWQEAALESMSSGEVLFFKQLREDRVLRPI
jgi:dephospho-CoA kinase